MNVFKTGMTLALVALPALAMAGGGKMEWNEQIHAESRDGKVVVTVTVDNASPSAVYVPAALYQERELFGRVFAITLQGGGEIAYVGPMVKRGPLGAADFVKVAPGKKLSNTIDITRSYDFKPGTHTYTLRYAGKVLTSLRDFDTAGTGALPGVSFTHTAR